MTERKEIDFDYEEGHRKEYGALLREARKQAREAAEEAPRKAHKNIWVKKDTIYWEVRISRFTATGVILGLMLFPLFIVYLILVLPFGVFSKTWARGSIPLPNDVQIS